MDFIRNLSYRSAYYVTQQMKESHQHRSVLYYGFQMLFGETVKIVLIFAASIAFNAFIPTVLLLLTFVLSRSFAGGYHMHTQLRCMITSFAVFLAVILFTKYSVPYWSFPYYILLIASVVTYCLYAALKYAPRDHPNKPITDASRRGRLKRLSVAFNMVWTAAAAIFLHIGEYQLVMSICLGALIAYFGITPLGFSFFDFLAGKIRSNKT